MAWMVRGDGVGGEMNVLFLPACVSLSWLGSRVRQLFVRESLSVVVSSPVSQLSRSQLSSESPSFSPAIGIPINLNSSSASLSGKK
jgi:hypothetical protein